MSLTQLVSVAAKTRGSGLRCSRLRPGSDTRGMAPPHILADRYELGALLGRGGMGSVYTAQDLVLGRQVAVKVLDVAQVPDEAVQRFRREARILASLSHPHIVTVFDFGADDATAWLVMELLAGPDLSQWLTEQTLMPVPLVLTLAQQVASALAQAHAAGIVHRDVKPANVMLAADGHCKLLDLGIARLVGATDTHAALTQTGMILGSVPFLAPEVISGRPSGPAGDLYGLGAVLFALLTGRPPFQGDTLTATLAQHLHASVTPPSTERSGVSVELDALVAALLAKQPQDRPTAQQAADWLERLADGEPAAAAALATRPGATEALTVTPAVTRLLTVPMRIDPPPSPIVPPGPAPRPARPGWAPTRTTLTVAAVVVAVMVLLLARSCTSPTSSPTAPTSLTATRQSAAPPGSASPPASNPPPTPAKPTSLDGALQALQTAVTSAANSGTLATPDARDLQQLIDDLRQALADGKTKDLAGKLADFTRRLQDVQHQGHLSPQAYHQILAAVQAVQAVQATSGGQQEGD